MRADASRPLPFVDGAFDAISCIDALNHLPGRPAVFADWARLLAPGGRLLFTDPVTVTGLVGAEELAIGARSATSTSRRPARTSACWPPPGLKVRRRRGH